MNVISPVAPYLAHNSNSQLTFSPPQDLAQTPLKPLDKNFIVTAAQNPDNPNTGWVKGFYVGNPEANLEASILEAREYVKANYPKLDPNKVFVSSLAEQSNNSSVSAPQQVLITGQDGKVSQIGRIQDTISAGRFQPPSIEERAVYQKMGLSNLHPELVNYNPATDKNIPPNSNIQSSPPQPAIESKSDRENEDTENDKAGSGRVSINIGDTAYRKSSIKPLGWGESVDKQA